MIHVVIPVHNRLKLTIDCTPKGSESDNTLAKMA